MASLESQISSLRDELATVYKTQGQNAQRLLAMNETLREKEEASRIESEHLRKAREEISHLRRKVDQHAELMAEKDRTAQVSSYISAPSIYPRPILISYFLRSFMTRSIPSSLNSARSRSVIRY